MKAKAVIPAGLCALAVALALPAGSVAATPPTVEPFHFTIGPTPGTTCGIDGTDVITADGVNVDGGQVWDRINAYHFTDTFTSSATGKWVEWVSGNVFKNVFVDNGDGTTSFYVWFSGDELIRQSNGPPIIGNDAGHTEGVITFDTATGAFLGFQLLFAAGPLTDHSLDAECGPIAAALT